MICHQVLLLSLLFVTFGCCYTTLDTGDTVQDHELLLQMAKTIGTSHWHTLSRINHNRTGVILIPGLIGTQLVAKWSHFGHGLFCSSSSGSKYRQLWLTLTSIVLQPSCTIDKLAQHWDGTRWVDSVDSIRYVPGLQGCEYIDPTNQISKAATSYWAALATSLEAAGYTRNVDVMGAGYDWRLGGDIATWRGLLKQTIEKSFFNTGKPVLLVAHSMGVMQTTLFLNTMTQQWRDQYIALYIAAAGPTLGAPGVLKGVLSGRQMIPGVSDAKTWKAEHFSATGAFASPFSMADTPEFKVEIKSTDEHFGASDIPTLFDRVGLGSSYPQQRLYQRNVMNAPNVTTHVVYSTGIQTTVGLTYPSFPVNNTIQPSDIMGDGDGTVPLYSSRYPVTAWKSQQSYPVTSTLLHKVSHAGMVKARVFIQLVMDKLASL